MDKKVEVDLLCPSCHHAQHLALTQSVDLDKEPNMQYAILTDSLFAHTCTDCQATFTVEHELLVVHREAGYAILVAPDWKEGPIAAPKDLHGLKLRLVKNTFELKDKVLCFESLLDDRTLELCKLYLAMRENPEEQVAYLFTEHRDGLLAFNKVNGDGGLLDMVTVPERLYLELDPKGRSIPTKDDAFIHVDGAWAFEQIASQEPQD